VTDECSVGLYGEVPGNFDAVLDLAEVAEEFSLTPDDPSDAVVEGYR